MSKKVGKGLIAMVLVITLIGFAGSAAAQDKPADNMDLVKEKIQTDKKTLNCNEHAADRI